LAEADNAAREALEASVRAFESGWNAGDATALARGFHDDATFVNRFGRLVEGRAAIIAMHAPLFASVYRASVMGCRVERMDMLCDAAACAYVRFDLKTGAAMPGGPTETPGRMQLVLSAGDDGWRIKAAANIAMVDPISGQPNAHL
jgi:uncharacterized protein (TIGR02246 family)